MLREPCVASEDEISSPQPPRTPSYLERHFNMTERAEMCSFAVVAPSARWCKPTARKVTSFLLAESCLDLTERENSLFRRCPERRHDLPCEAFVALCRPELCSAVRGGSVNRSIVQSYVKRARALAVCTLAGPADLRQVCGCACRCPVAAAEALM